MPVCPCARAPLSLCAQRRQRAAAGLWAAGPPGCCAEHAGLTDAADTTSACSSLGYNHQQETNCAPAAATIAVLDRFEEILEKLIAGIVSEDSNDLV